VRPGRAADHSPPSSDRSHGRVELYVYPPSGPHRACNGITLPLHLPLLIDTCACLGMLMQLHLANVSFSSCCYMYDHSSLVLSLEGWAWQEPEPSRVTSIGLAHCILGKFLGVVCHCFPAPLDFPTLAVRCLRP